jgi:hypothetical protein
LVEVFIDTGRGVNGGILQGRRWSIRVVLRDRDIRTAGLVGKRDNRLDRLVRLNSLVGLWVPGSVVVVENWLAGYLGAVCGISGDGGAGGARRTVSVVVGDVDAVRNVMELVVDGDTGSETIGGATGSTTDWVLDGALDGALDRAFGRVLNWSTGKAAVWTVVRDVGRDMIREILQSVDSFVPVL